MVINAFNDEAFVIVSDVGEFNLRESGRYTRRASNQIFVHKNNNNILYEMKFRKSRFFQH